MKDSAYKQSLKITIIYATVATLWIFFSDSFVALISINPSFDHVISIVKGLLFVLITSYLNFNLIKRILQKQINSTSLLNSVIESSPELLIYSLDTNYCYLTFNKAYEHLVYDIFHKHIEPGMNIFEVFDDENDIENAKSNFDRALNGENFNIIEKFNNKIFSNIRMQGYYSPINSDDNSISGLTCFILNVTSLKQSEEKNLYLSYHDPLTGLYNRRFFEVASKKIDVESNYPLSLITADVNGLKFTNDVFGHLAGDELIKAFADILIKECRKDDIVCRVGGDEFYILLQNTNIDNLTKIIYRIQSSISKKALAKGFLSVSFGYSTKTSSDLPIEELISKSDTIMYNNKLLNRDNYEIELLNNIYLNLYNLSETEDSHSRNVAKLCRKIGLALNLDDSTNKLLERAGFLHDIGKIAIDYNILKKPGKLNKSEYKEVKRHSGLGFKILSFFKKYENIAEYVLYHHERVDGNGYPKGLIGDHIPLISRIIFIADAFDAMTSFSYYKKTLTVDEAVEEIKKNAGTQFDPEITKVFIEKVLHKRWS